MVLSDNEIRDIIRDYGSNYTLESMNLNPPSMFEIKSKFPRIIFSRGSLNLISKQDYMSFECRHNYLRYIVFYIDGEVDKEEYKNIFKKGDVVLTLNNQCPIKHARFVPEMLSIISDIPESTFSLKHIKDGSVSGINIKRIEFHFDYMV